MMARAAGRFTGVDVPQAASKAAASSATHKPRKLAMPVRALCKIIALSA